MRISRSYSPLCTATSQSRRRILCLPPNRSATPIFIIRMLRPFYQEALPLPPSSFLGWGIGKRRTGWWWCWDVGGDENRELKGCGTAVAQGEGRGQPWPVQEEEDSCIHICSYIQSLQRAKERIKSLLSKNVKKLKILRDASRAHAAWEPLLQMYTSRISHRNKTKYGALHAARVVLVVYYLTFEVKLIFLRMSQQETAAKLLTASM